MDVRYYATRGRASVRWPLADCQSHRVGGRDLRRPSASAAMRAKRLPEFSLYHRTLNRSRVDLSVARLAVDTFLAGAPPPSAAHERPDNASSEAFADHFLPADDVPSYRTCLAGVWTAREWRCPAGDKCRRLGWFCLGARGSAPMPPGLRRPTDGPGRHQLPGRGAVTGLRVMCSGFSQVVMGAAGTRPRDLPFAFADR